MGKLKPLAKIVNLVQTTMTLMNNYTKKARIMTPRLKCSMKSL